LKHFTSFVGMAAWLSVAAFAGTIVNNGTPDNVNAYNITQYRAADDFTLAGASTAASIQFWIATINPSDFNGSITYAFYADNSGALGTQIALGTVSGLTPGAVEGNLGPYIFYPVSFNFVSPVSLAAGTYWLELHEGASLTANDGTATFWAESAQSGNAKQDSNPTLPTTSRNVELAFQIFDTAIASTPEPGSMALTSLGIGALVCFARRWRRV
jgi:hypothetical protein